MTLLSRIPLALWLAAGLALAVAWGMWQRDRARDAQAALRASESVVAALNDYAYDVAGIEIALRDGLTALADLPDTGECAASPAIQSVLEALRE